jgi:hypothetical protein
MRSSTGLAACRLNPGGCIVSDSRQNTKVFLAEVVSRAAPKPFPDVISGKKKEQS